MSLDGLFETAWWMERLKARNNDTFIPLFFDEHRYLPVMGGGGSGKSWFAGDKLLERATSEPGHRFLVVRKVARTLRQSCFAQLKERAYEHFAPYIDRIYEGDLRMVFTNGSEILFAGCDDAEKLKSIYNITGMWIEEASELTEDDFNQLDIRLRGEIINYQQIILTFNPISILHWLKRRFFDCVGKEGKPLPDYERAKIRTHTSTYKDNRFLPDENKAVLEGFKYADEYYYNVYCLGQWGVTGKTVFDAQAITERLAVLAPAEDTGYFTYEDFGAGIKDIKWVSDKNGWITIYKKAQEYRHYVIGGDTAGTGSDSFVAQVLDNYTGEQVAVLHHRYGEEEYAKQVYCLGMTYNEALIGIEVNFSTYPVRELERLRYPNQYVRETLDSYTHKIKKSFGFETNQKTRNTIIYNLIAWMREEVGTVNDRTTLEEMLTFVRTDEFRMEAEEGAHDDCIMSLAIAHFIRPQQRYMDDIPAKSGRRWTKDMLDDYRRGTESDRAIMRSMWGEPG